MQEKLTFWKYLRNNHPFSSGVVLASLFCTAFGIADKNAFVITWGILILTVFVIAGLFDVRKINNRRKRGTGT